MILSVRLIPRPTVLAVTSSFVRLLSRSQAAGDEK
jgi:hypothetical protein